MDIEINTVAYVVGITAALAIAFAMLVVIIVLGVIHAVRYIRGGMR